MSTPACPEPARLADYSLGKLPWDELERLEQHVDDCPSCQQTLNQFERPSDTFVRKMRAGEVVAAVAAPTAAPHLHESELKAALARALQAPQPEEKNTAPARTHEPAPSGIGKAGGDKPRDSRIPQTVADFLQLLAASQLMTAAEAKAFLDSLPPRHQPADAKAAAALFAHACKLTPYQARALYQGKPNNLVIADREMLDLLGKGGMGNVFKARNRRLDRLEAIKVISSKKLESPDAKERFNREARAAARLNHPNVVATYDAGEANGVNFLSMEFVDGLDLSKTIKQRGPLSPEHAVNCILQAAAGLQAAHDAGIIHRDIKPHNLLLDRQGHVKVLDLGLARMNDSASLAANEGLTQSGQVMGTIDYMSPEQTIDVRKVTPASDVYSLGCTLHFLLTGRPPFSAETLGAKMMAHHHEAPPSLTAVCPQASPALDAVFQKMLAKDPAQRYATMDDVSIALQSLAQHTAHAAEPLLPPPLPSTETEGNKLTEFLSQMAVSQDLPLPQIAKHNPLLQPAAASVAAPSLSAHTTERPPSRIPASIAALSPTQIFLSALSLTLLFGGLVLLGVYLLIKTPEGTIEIRLGPGVKTEDVEVVLRGDGMSFSISKKNGTDAKDGGFNVQVREGKYQVELKNKADQLTLDKHSLTITRDGKVVLSVTQIPIQFPSHVPADAIAYNGHFYKAFSGKISWTAAQAECERLQGYLACAETKEEAEYLGNFGDRVDLWLGGRFVADKWNWASGKPFLVDHWFTGEGGGGSGEHFTTRTPGGTWFDVVDDNYANDGYICEWEAKPIELKTHLPPGYTDLLALIDPTKQAKVGPWVRAGTAIITKTPVNGQRIYSPHKVDPSYHLECELEVVSGSDCGLLLPVGDATALLALWHAGGTKSMLQLSREYPDHIVEFKAPPQPRSPVKVSVSVQVSADLKQARIQVDADGHPRLQWQGPLSSITFQQSAFWQPRPNLVGLNAHLSAVNYNSLVYRKQADLVEDNSIYPANGDELAPDKWYDLLPAVDVNKHILNGEAVRDTNGVTFTRGHGPHFIAPFTTTGSYEVRCSFTRNFGSHELQIVLPLGNGASTNLMFSGWSGGHGGLAYLRGQNVENGARSEAVIRPSPLTNGRKHHCLAAVDILGDQVQISAELDGTSVLTWSGPRADLSSMYWMAYPRSDLLGIGVSDMLTTVHEFQVRPRGEPLRRWKPTEVLALEPPESIKGECVRWNGHWYWSTQNRMHLPAAIALANQHGGRLLEISSASEHRFICNQYPDREFFLGAWRDYREPEGRKAWLNNRLAPLQYAGPWMLNQPEMRNSETTLCIMTRGQGEWHDHWDNADLNLCIEWGDEGAQNVAVVDPSPVSYPLPSPPFNISTNGLGGKKSLLPTVWPNAWREDGQFAHVRGPGTIWYPEKTFFNNVGFSYAVELEFTCNPGRGTLNFAVGDNLDCNLSIPIDVQHVVDNPERCDIKLMNWLNEGRWHWGHHEFKVGARKRISILVNESLYAAVENGQVILRGHGSPSDPTFRIGTDSELLDVVIHRCEIRPLVDQDLIALRAWRWKAPPSNPSADKATASARWRRQKEIWQKQNEGLDNKPLKDKPFITATTQTPLVWVPAGSFGMGWTPPERPTGWKTEITRPFWIGKYEVTQQEWGRLMQFGNPSRLEFPYLPVGNVTYADCLRFCASLNEREQASIPEGYEFRLPTEAEWEYACRAGRTGEFNAPASESWTISNSDWRPHDVGESTANPWGIYDMLGNQLEWCLDAWHDYPASPDLRKDPFTPPTAWNQRRICRGGSWWLLDGSTPWGRWSHYDVPGGYRGFRIVLGPKLTDKIPPQVLDPFAPDTLTPPTAIPAALRVPPAGKKMEVGKWYDLLETVDVRKHAINGLWKRDGAQVVSQLRDENRLVAPVRLLSGEYELALEFTRYGAAEAFNIGLPLANGGYANAGLWGWGGRFSGPVKVGGTMLADHPESTPWRVLTPSEGERRYSTSVRVSSDGNYAKLSAKLDGFPFWEWEGPQSQLGIDPGAPPPRTDQLLLGTWAAYRIHAWRLRLISGSGERIYDGTPAAAKEPPAKIKAQCVHSNGKPYWISPTPVDIGEAMRLAGEHQARLLTISSAEEEQFIKTTFPGKDIRLGAWRNANNPDPRIGWVDSDLRPLTYFGNWAPGQPDGNQVTLTLHEDAWHDSDPGWPFHAVLEWGAENPLLVIGPLTSGSISPPVLATSATPLTPSRNGLAAEYFSGLNFDTPILKRIDSQLDFCWGFEAPAAEVPSDVWSARWTGWIKVPQPGRYRFAVLNDDGLRIWIDDKLVVDDWRGHFAERREFSVDLTASPHSVRVEYYEESLTAFLTWRYLTPDGREAPCPADWLFHDRATAVSTAVRHPPVAKLTPQNGLKAEYFHTAELTDLVESRSEPQIDHLWGFDNPRPNVPADGFAVRWSGWLTPPVAGEYELSLWIDDRGVVQLDDRAVVHAPQGGPTRIVKNKQVLEARPYKIEVIAVEGELTAIASLRWTPPGETRSLPIPPECFFVSPPPKRSP